MKMKALSPSSEVSVVVSKQSPCQIMGALLLLFLISGVGLHAQPVSLVKDINPIAGGGNSSPTNITELNGQAYYSCNDGIHGLELWRSDGTAAGTVLVKDICPGIHGSMPETFLTIGDRLFFSAFDSIHGCELWQSDGTEAGTTLAADIQSGSQGSAPANLVNVDGMLYFTADDGIHGRELWKSDGTTSGTTLVADICPGANSSQMQQLTSYKGTLLFCADDGIHGLELWKSDGTGAGTVMIADIIPGTRGGMSPFGISTSLLMKDDGVYFTASDGTNGVALWKTDATPAGTAQIASLPNTSCLAPCLVNLNGMLLLSVYDFERGNQWWRSDGTRAGTVPITNILANSLGVVPYWVTARTVTVVDTNLFFPGYYDNTTGLNLWKTDGTAEGTMLVKDFTSSNSIATIGRMMNFNGKIVFTASNSVSGYELWQSDGTAAGTTLIRDIATGKASSKPVGLANINGRLFFQANDGIHGAELWQSDGTGAGTSLVRDVRIWPGDANPTALTWWSNRLYFAANDGVHTNGLWQSDGTPGGTKMLKNLYPGLGGSNPKQILPAGNSLYFSTLNALWKTDGTSNGTVEIQSFSTKVPQSLVMMIGHLFIALNAGGEGSLWQSDGTTTGTEELSDLVSETRPSSSPENMIAVGDMLYFTANSAYHGVFQRKLWQSDGTTAGTTMIPLDYLGQEFWGAGNLLNVNGVLFFTAWYNSAQPQVFKLTAAGAVPLGVAPETDPTPSDLGSLVNVDGTIFLRASDIIHGPELWRTDEVMTNLVLIKDIWPGPDGSYPANLTGFDGTLVFTASDGVHGFELWKSDGTAAGTVMIKDICPGNGDAMPGQFIAAGGVIYFAANNGVNGTELWRTDGTAPGTVMVADITGDFTSSSPANLTVAGTQLFFTAQTGTTGNELYTLPLLSGGPQAADDRVTTTIDHPVSLTFQEMLQNDGSPDGGAVAFAGVDNSSVFAGNVATVENTVIYTPPPGFSGMDSFSYTITNGMGLARGTVLVSVLNTTNPLHHIVVQHSDRCCQFTFTGIPNSTYRLEMSTNLAAGNWSEVQNLEMSSTGVGQLELTNLPSPSFFRFTAD